MNARPQTLGEMRRVILAARAQAVTASKQRAGRHHAAREDVDAGNEVAIELATECGFLSAEGERTWLGRRSVLYPDTPYAFDATERAAVASVRHDVHEVRRLNASALAVLDLTAAEVKQADRDCRAHEARIRAAAAKSGIAVERILSLANAELDEEQRHRSNALRRANREFERAAA